MGKRKDGLTRQGVPDLGHDGNKRRRSTEHDKTLEGAKMPQDGFDFYALFKGEETRKKRSK